MSDFEKLNKLASPPPAALPGTVRFYADADGEVRLIDENSVVSSIRSPFPKQLNTVRLPTFAGGLAAGATHTYTVPLGAAYSEILLADFQWITTGNTNPDQPGTVLGHGVFDQDNIGPMIVANTIPGKWHRVYKMAAVELANNTLTDLEAPIFAGASEAAVPLGYGVDPKNVVVDHIDVFGKKVQVEDVYIVGTDLIVKLKNVEPVDTVNFDVYAGVVRVFGYRDDTYFATVAAGGFMSIGADRHSTSLWISTDYGLSWNAFPEGAHDKVLAGNSTYRDTGTLEYFMAFLDYDFSVWTGNSPGWAWSQVNSWALPWGGDDYQLNGGSNTNRQSYGGNVIDWNESIGAFFAFHSYTMDATVFFSNSAFVDIGANSPDFDDVEPVFRGTDWIAEMSPYNPGGTIGQAQNQNPYVRVIDTDQDVFVSFCYLAGGISQVTEITCTADTAGSLQSTYFFIGAEQDAGNRYRVWNNVSGGGSEPGSGGIPLEVDFNLNDADTAVAAALDAALTGTGDFTCSTVGAVVTATAVNPGFTSGPQDLSTGFGFNVTVNGVSYRRQALFHSSDQGANWVELLGASPDWKDASNRFVNVSDDGSVILVAVIGETGHAAYPYLNQEIRFNRSTDGGATWTYPDGSWVLVASTAATTYSSQDNNSPYVSEGLIASVPGNAVICIFRAADHNDTPTITRSGDDGATWDTPAQLVAWSNPGPDPQNNRGRQSDAIDEFFAFISYGYAANDTQSFAYKGKQVTTLTNWDAFGVV